MTTVQTSAEDSSNTIAILGGTFDPLHFGHINSAKHTAEQFNLTEIVLLPAHIPPHKKSVGASAEHRLTMLNSYVKTDPFFSVDSRELATDRTSFTVFTLKEIKAKHPNKKLYFIIGMDSLLTFTRWHLWQEILTYCHIIVNTRPGYDISSTKNLPKETQQLLSQYQTTDKAALTHYCAGKIFITPTIDFDISSSTLRQQIALALNKQDIESDVDQNEKHIQATLFCKKWLPSPILCFIKQHKLYQTS